MIKAGSLAVVTIRVTAIVHVRRYPIGYLPGLVFHRLYSAHKRVKVLAASLSDTGP